MVGGGVTNLALCLLRKGHGETLAGKEASCRWTNRQIYSLCGKPRDLTLRTSWSGSGFELSFWGVSEGLD